MIALRFAKAGSVLAVLTLAGGMTPAGAAPSGDVVAVIQASHAEGDSGNRMLDVASPIYSGDKIVTGAIGETQIKFRDNTKLVVGTNSTMAIDAFVFNDNNTARQVSIEAVTGAFGFITGVSSKDAYSISTPTATIAVRGTEFDFNVDRFNGNTELVMFGGMTRICPKDKTHACIEARTGCGMTIIPPGGDVSQLKASVARNTIINRDFRYIRSQAGLHDEFRVNTGSCGNTSASPTSSPGSFQTVPLSSPVAPPPPPPPPPPCGPGGQAGHTGENGHTGHTGEQGPG